MVVGKAGREATEHKAFGIIRPPYINRRAHKKVELSRHFLIYLFVNLLFCFVFWNEKYLSKRSLEKRGCYKSKRKAGLQLLQLELVNICIPNQSSACQEK